jgi:SPP1 family predicted phage head-tail adaptor
MRLDAGRLRQRINLQSATRTRDSSGTPIDTWADAIGPLPAEALAVGGGEQLRGRQVHAEATMVFIVRWRSDVTVKMRVIWGGLPWGIVFAGDPYGDRDQLRIECRGAV